MWNIVAGTVQYGIEIANSPSPNRVFYVGSVPTNDIEGAVRAYDPDVVCEM